MCFRIRLRFFIRTILFLILRQCLQFLYQCFAKTFIARIINNCPLNCFRNTLKTDEVYDFLRCANLTCVDDLSTQKRRSNSQPLCDYIIKRLYLHEYIAEQEEFSSFWVQRSSTKVGLARRRLCPFSMCRCNNFGTITNNAGNGSLLDKLVPKLKKMMKNK